MSDMEQAFLYLEVCLEASIWTRSCPSLLGYPRDAWIEMTGTSLQPAVRAVYSGNQRWPS